MRWASVCSGIEAPSVAWKSLEWTPVFFSEIEKFPCEVLKYHYPEVPNFGDMTKVKEWEYEKIELLIGGTPCQSYSTAGLRKGLDDPRGNLMLIFGAVIEKYRPRWVIWENVPGVLSSNKGNDFREFLQMLDELGYGYAYRVLDSQYFGVPQRRRRVFVVGYIGNKEYPKQILFEQESLFRNTAKGGIKRKKTANNVAESSAENYKSIGFYHTNIQPENGNYNDVSPTLKVGSGGQSGNPPGVCYSFDSLSSNSMKSKNPDSGCREISMSRTLDTWNPDPSKNQGGVGILQNYMVRKLMPIECERLMGFPDNYTQIPFRGKNKEDCSDGVRYKSLGNSMVVSVVWWIGARIQMLEETFKESIK